MESCSKGQNVNVDFILVVPEEIENKENYLKAFNKMESKLKPPF
jgi:mannitol/fructose-specific phosphotransferase system IIA component (Ntr-type)